MQKLFTLFIAIILSALPIVNASASLPSCHNTMPDSLSMSESHSHSMIGETSVDTDNASSMTSMHDCCETQDMLCDHANGCDCEKPQVNYSAIPMLQIEHLQYFGDFKPPYISPHFHSKPSDSLYRPPINIFI